MKLELTGKAISRKSVYDAIPDKNCSEALRLYEHFEACFKRLDFSADLSRLFPTQLIYYLSNNSEARDFALEHNFVRESYPQVKKGQIYRHKNGSYYIVQVTQQKPETGTWTWCLANVTGLLRGNRWRQETENIQEIFGLSRDDFVGPLEGNFEFVAD